MKWKVLAWLDIAFSSLAIITAGIFGNSLIAARVPALHNNATWLSRLVMKGLISPNSLADWLVGTLPAVTLPLLFAALVAAEMIMLMLITRLKARMISRLFVRSAIACIVGALAGTLAWAVALLINAHSGGVIQTLAIVIGIVVLLFVSDLLGEIVPAVAEADAEVDNG
jgi:hypothetical protein